eukprot:1621912-Rhodomonas_salina.1
MLTHTLVDYLMGEHDRIVKDPNYIFRLYMALGNYRQARAVLFVCACMPLSRIEPEEQRRQSADVDGVVCGSQAARTAVIIARQEQEMGNYKVAHKMLFDTYKVGPRHSAFEHIRAN